MEWINEKSKGLSQGAIRVMFDKANAMSDVISMGIGEPDMATPAPVCAAAAEAMAMGMTHYTHNAGTIELRRAIAEKSYLKALAYDPEREIIVTNGGMGALSLLFLVILNDGDEVLIQDPQWLNYAAQVSYCGGVPVRVPTDFEHGFEMRSKDIEARITPHTKAIMINTPNNPTGQVLSRKCIENIAAIAKKHDILVISDEIYNTLLYDGAECESIAFLPDMKERTVVINSYSKSYAMTGWRLGYICAPESIVDRMTKCQENFNSCANSIAQHAGAAALEWPELCEGLRIIFAERRAVLIDRLSNISGLRFHVPMGAFYAFVDISAFGLTSWEFCMRLLEEAHVVCIPGSAFGECGEGFIRFAYTCDKERINEAMDRFERFCAGLDNAAQKAHN